MLNMTEPKIIELPKVEDPRGNLTFIQNDLEIPFEIKRVYWMYDVPGGKHRGSHAFRNAEEFIVAMSGAFEVEILSGQNKRVFNLNRSYFGLYIPKMTWRSIANFSSNSMALVLSSTTYDEADYIREEKELMNIDDGV